MVGSSNIKTTIPDGHITLKGGIAKYRMHSGQYDHSVVPIAYFQQFANTRNPELQEAIKHFKTLSPRERLNMLNIYDKSIEAHGCTTINPCFGKCLPLMKAIDELHNPEKHANMTNMESAEEQLAFDIGFVKQARAMGRQDEEIINLYKQAGGMWNDFKGGFKSFFGMNGGQPQAQPAASQYNNNAAHHQYTNSMDNMNSMERATGNNAATPSARPTPINNNLGPRQPQMMTRPQGMAQGMDSMSLGRRMLGQNNNVGTSGALSGNPFTITPRPNANTMTAGQPTRTKPVGGMFNNSPQDYAKHNIGQIANIQRNAFQTAMQPGASTSGYHAATQFRNDQMNQGPQGHSQGFASMMSKPNTQQIPTPSMPQINQGFVQSAANRIAGNPMALGGFSGVHGTLGDIQQTSGYTGGVAGAGRIGDNLAGASRMGGGRRGCAGGVC